MALVGKITHFDEKKYKPLECPIHRGYEYANYDVDEFIRTNESAQTYIVSSGDKDVQVKRVSGFISDLCASKNDIDIYDKNYLI